MHASDTILEKLERLQSHYVKELHITEESAFLYFNFAPPCLRRDVGILGFLHKRTLGEAHAAIEALLPFDTPHAPWHNKPLNTRMFECTRRPNLFNRSVFGMAHVYITDCRKELWTAHG